jgi:purine-nucleoside phosphorylase
LDRFPSPVPAIFEVFCYRELLPSGAMSNNPSPAAQIEAGITAWKERGWPAPDVIFVSGSGLGVELGEPAFGPVPLAEVLPFPVHALIGHQHEVELHRVTPSEGVERVVLYYRGRIHAYQGYDSHQTVYAVRLGARLGARVLLMTNAAGGMNPDFEPGDLVLVNDHLNLSGMNPLVGQLPPDWGPQFPDMVEAYNPELRQTILGLAEELGIPLRQGVYGGLLGPTYETRAEVRMLRTLGADLAGMSTVQEVIAAHHLGVRCAVLSLVTNLAAGVSPNPLDHEEVLEAGQKARGTVGRLLAAVLAALD